MDAPLKHIVREWMRSQIPHHDKCDIRAYIEIVGTLVPPPYLFFFQPTTYPVHHIYYICYPSTNIIGSVPAVLIMHTHVHYTHVHGARSQVHTCYPSNNIIDSAPAVLIMYTHLQYPHHVPRPVPCAHKQLHKGSDTATLMVIAYL